MSKQLRQEKYKWIFQIHISRQIKTPNQNTEMPNLTCNQESEN